MNKKLQDELKIKLSGVLPELNERQRRILLAAEAESIGYGGIKILSNISGAAVSTIRRGIKELKKKPKKLISVRREGGGRKRSVETNPELTKILQEIIEPETRGDPENPLRWTCKSVRNISDALKKEKLDVSHQTVASILHELEYSLQGNKKTKEGADEPDRNRQFLYINKLAKKFLKNNDPAISVDAKKKELVGNYKNVGRELSKKGKPIEVNGHDFPDPKISKAVPYGVYDIGDNKGWVNVGISSDTAEFAVESIRQWWLKMGSKRYPDSTKLLIFADAGGSNGYRSRLWKKEVQKLSNRENLEITVCHFPPGTSKWNKIEHRLFSFISINWRGKPLLSYEVIINLIASTKTKTGLSVKARLDKKTYKKGIEVTDQELKKINLLKHSFHGEWNYTIKPSTKA
ncbi:MAG: ISAzo13 family transposase [Bacteriovoracaceae bacterium]|nr:ISAzo13 family transposase [Bacteriovoracaceae bacterium]